MVLFTWSSSNFKIFAAAIAGPNIPKTGPAWNPRAITVGMKSAASLSITSYPAARPVRNSFPEAPEVSAATNVPGTILVPG